MRVIAGSARSLKLKSPEGLNTRPTLDKVKETLFNCIQYEVPGAVFLDLYAGSGAIGIEALSRGAKYAYFIENNKSALKCIEENLKFTRLSNRACVLNQDVMFFLKHSLKQKADIVFLDPPYENHDELKVLDFLANYEYIDEDSIIIVEANLDADLKQMEAFGFEVYKIKKYKTNQHIFLKRRVEE